jgi:N-acylneuraminate cytidylyltransferase
MNVAIIPARGGSKRVPRKNIRPFAGQPMIAHSIHCALRSGLFQRVIVSTDDDQIAAVAREQGAEVPFKRPEALSHDRAGTVEVITHAIRWLQANGVHPTAVCCLYATAPFIRESDLAGALSELERGGWQYVFSATSFAFPIYRSFEQNADGGLAMVFPQYFETRSQDLPEALHDAAQFYWARPETWLTNPNLYGASSTVIRIPRWRTQDIDTAEDWARAELMWRALQDSESLERSHRG